MVVLVIPERMGKIEYRVGLEIQEYTRRTTHNRKDMVDPRTIRACVTISRRKEMGQKTSPCIRKSSEKEGKVSTDAGLEYAWNFSVCLVKSSSETSKQIRTAKNEEEVLNTCNREMVSEVLESV